MIGERKECRLARIYQVMLKKFSANEEHWAAEMSGRDYLVAEVRDIRIFRTR